MARTHFRQVLISESDFLKHYARSLTDDAEDSKDLFQETIMKALVNEDKYKAGTNLKAWLYCIMRNTFINGYRKSKKFPTVSISDDSVMYHPGKKAINDGISKTRLNEILKEIELLPKVSRQSFQLHYMGYKYSSIAKILNEPIGTVKSKIHIARKTLISSLER